MEHSDRRIHIDGVEIVYREAGDPESPAIVYVHGNTAGRIWFADTMTVTGYRTVALDLPNFGDSGRLGRADIDEYADYLAGFMEALGLRPVTLVGHSLGGLVAVSLVARYPSLVSRLALVDSPDVSGLVTPEEHYPVIERYRDDRDLLKRALATVTPGLDDETILDALTDNARKMNPIAFTENARALARFDYRGRLDDITIPVLVVRGELDALISDEVGRATTARFQNARYRVFKGVGHSPMVEAPQRFVAALRDFADGRP